MDGGAGIISALGVETGTFLHVVAAVCGSATLIADHPLAFTALRYAGAELPRPPGRTCAAPPSSPAVGVADAAGRPARRRLLRLYCDAVLVNLFNPKVVLFFLAFLPQFLPTGLPPADTRTRMLVLGAVFLSIALALDLCYALIGAALTGRLRGTPRRARRLSYLTSGVYLGLAALVFI
ncbi:LysE family translocator [Streptomyces olivoverticillatus]